MKLHLTDDCPLGQVKCKLYESNGCYECTGFVARKDFQCHNTSVVRLTAIIQRLSRSGSVDGGVSHVVEELVTESIPASNKRKRFETNNRRAGTNVQVILKGKWVDAQVLDYKSTAPKALLLVNDKEIWEGLGDIQLVAGSLMVVHSDDHDGGTKWWIMANSGDRPKFVGEKIVYKMQSMSSESSRLKIEVALSDMNFVTPYCPNEIKVFHPAYGEALKKLNRSYY
jgi:hypothetical protein